MDPASARATLVQGIARIFLAGRTVARGVGLTRLDAELGTVSPELEGLIVTPRGDPAGFDKALTAWALLDRRRAMRAAGGYGDRWLQLVRQEIRSGTLTPYQAALIGADPRLKTAAITETSQAFSAARQDAVHALARRNIGTELVRVWNSELDRRTCEHCLRMSGRWVSASENFPEGDPGAVHPRCRCHDELVPRTWVDSLDIAA